MRQKTCLFLCLLFFYSLNCFSQIVNADTLFINNNTLVFFGSEYINNGFHQSDGNLYLNSNFINNDTTTSNSGTTFFKSSDNSIQSISGSSNTLNFYNLEIDNSLTGVEVADDFGILVKNAVSLTNGDLLTVSLNLIAK